MSEVQPLADSPDATPLETQADPSIGSVETKEAAEPPPELPEAPQSPPAADPAPAEVAEPVSPRAPQNDSIPSADAAAPPLQLPATHFELLPPPPPPGGLSPGDYVLPPAFPSPGGEHGQLTAQQQQWQQEWQAMGPQGGEIAPTEQWGAMGQWGAMEGWDGNGFAAEPEFDHNAARQKIAQYRKEAAARRRRQMRVAEKKSLAMRAELEKESELMARRQAEREMELKAKRDERYQKQAEERRLRQEERETKLQKKKKSSGSPTAPKRKPLYLQMEEQYRRKEAHEEQKRKEALKSQRAKFEPVDYVELNKEAEELRQRAKEAWEAKHKAAVESSPGPPPMRQLYRGKTHQRIVQEVSANASTREAVRSKAQARRDASLRYAKLVSELSDASNPAEGVSSFDSASPAIARAGLAPGTTPGAAGGPVDMKALGAAASALNQQVREKEEQVQRMRGGGGSGSPTAAPSDELLANHAQLSQLYVQAIRAKLDLFEGLASSA